MKHINIFFTRVYVVQILHAYFMNNKTASWQELQTINMQELFEETMNYSIDNIDLQLKNDILKTYVEKLDYINNLRETYQDRNSVSVDYILIIIINTAVAEYLTRPISMKIIISEYINICSIFHSATQFVHGILNKILNNL